MKPTFELFKFVATYNSLQVVAAIKYFTSHKRKN